MRSPVTSLSNWANQDEIIDSNDTNFSDLKILKGDGTLLTLAEANIASINLSQGLQIQPTETVTINYGQVLIQKQIIQLLLMVITIFLLIKLVQ